VPSTFVNECGEQDKTDQRAETTPGGQFDERAGVSDFERKRELARLVSPKPEEEFKYDPTGEWKVITGAREDYANLYNELQTMLQDRAKSCAPDWWWDWVRGNPIWKTERRLATREFMIDLYEDTYVQARKRGKDHEQAQFEAHTAVDWWIQQSRFELLAQTISTLSSMAEGVATAATMKELEHTLSQLEGQAKAVSQERFDQVKRLTERARARRAAAASEGGGGVQEGTQKYGPGEAPTQKYGPGMEPRPAQKGPGTQEAAAGEGQPSSGKGMNKKELDDYLNSKPSYMETNPENAPKVKPLPPRRPASEWGKLPEGATCPKPTNAAKQRELEKLMADVEKRGDAAEQVSDRLTRNRAGEKDPDWFKENPGDQLSTAERERLERDFDRMNQENLRDLSKAIQLQNELYPKQPGRPILTQQEVQSLGLGKGQAGPTGPGGTQVIPRTGPGQTQPLRGPGDTQRLP
jgi:hypothetical protein